MNANDFLLGALLPGLVALAVRAAGLRLTRGDAIAWPAAMALGYAAGQAGLMISEGAGAAVYWPRQASHWLPLAGLLGAGIAMVAGCCRAGKVAAVVAGGLLAVGLPLRLLWGSVYLTSDWPPSEAATKIGGIAAVLFGVGWLITKANASPSKKPNTDAESLPKDDSTVNASNELLSTNEKHACGSATGHVGQGSWLIAPLLVLTATGLAVVLATSGSLSYARLAGVLAAAIGGAALGGLGQLPWTGVTRGVSSAGPVVAVLAGGLLLLGGMYAEVTPRNAGLLVAALVAGGAARGWAPRCRWRSAVLRGMAWLVPLTLATVAATTDFAEATSAKEDNPYLNWTPPGGAGD